MPLIDILIPEEIGPVDECVVVTWLKREGDSIKQGQDLLIIQAEKASYDIPSPATGTVSAILVQQGEVAKQDQPLARLEVSQTDFAPTPVHRAGTGYCFTVVAAVSGPGLAYRQKTGSPTRHRSDSNQRQRNRRPHHRKGYPGDH